MIVCKECEKFFDSDKKLHGHLRAHKIKKTQYYQKHYPKKCLQTGKAIPFKDSDDLESYLKRDFYDRTALNLYFDDSTKPLEKQELLLKYLEDTYKKHNIIPSQVELSSLPCSPTILHYTNFFDFYKLIQEKNLKSRFDYGFDYYSPLKLPEINLEQFCISIDTREQLGYRMFNSINQKLDFGDYALSNLLYNKTHIERKSISDFGSTMVGGNLRFRKELDRVRGCGGYLIILVEHELEKFSTHRFFGFARPSLISHEMRGILREYSDVTQVVFGGNREKCVKYVVEFLLYGMKCKEIDLQYYVDVNVNQFKSQEFSKGDLLNLYSYQ